VHEGGEGDANAQIGEVVEGGRAAEAEEKETWEKIGSVENDSEEKKDNTTKGLFFPKQANQGPGQPSCTKA
jgi:hypothetical protein